MAKPSRRYRWRRASCLTAALSIAACAIPVHAGVGDATRLAPALLQVSINGQEAPDAAVVLRDTNGRFYLPADTFSQWRLKPPTTHVAHEGERYFALDMAGMKVVADEAMQRLYVTAPPELFEATRISLSSDAGRATDHGRGAYLNYELTGQHAAGASSAGVALETVAFSPLGVAAASFVGHLGRDGADLIRLDANLTLDDVSDMSSLRIGDSITRGGVGGSPLRFAGVQWARNFAVQPGYVTFPAPAIGGSAAVPSVVEVLVNNALQARREVPAGPFDITDLPVVTGDGSAELVVRDALGRETRTTQSYYAAASALRAGLHDFSYEFGFLRRRFGRESNDYGALMGAATHRYGFTNELTGETHVELTADQQVLGIGAGVTVPELGFFDLSVTGSRGDDGQGGAARIGFERRSRELSFGARAEFATDGFRNLGQPLGRRAPQETVQAFLGLPTSFGSIGGNYIRIDERDSLDSELLGLSASVRLGGLGSLFLSVQHVLAGRSATSVGLLFAAPLGARRSVSASVEAGREGELARATIQQSQRVGGGIGYQLSVAQGATDRLDGRLSYRNPYGDYDAEVTWTEAGSGIRLSAAGSVGVADGAPFASRRLTDSFAVVRVGAFEGVRVYADNQHVATTNAAGVAVVPRLRAHERNSLRIELADLPWDAAVTSAEEQVRPAARAGVGVKFDARSARGALMTIVLEDGSSLPPGADIYVEGNAEGFVSAPGGEAYLTGLKETNLVQAVWGGKSCRFSVAYPRNPEPLPRLGAMLCRMVKS